MWAIFKTFIEFATILLLFCFFVQEAYSFLAPQPGIRPTPSVLEGKVLTTGHQGSPCNRYYEQPPVRDEGTPEKLASCPKSQSWATSRYSEKENRKGHGQNRV